MRYALFALLTASAAPAFAQDHTGHDMAGMESMPGMDHGAMAAAQAKDKCGRVLAPDFSDPEGTSDIMLPAACLPAEGSGTARLPFWNDGRYGGMHSNGLHLMSGKWMLMAHGAVSAQYSKATGPRGDDKVYVTSMAMLMAQRDTDWGRVQLKSMLSLEPAMDAAGYPNLFATGETAGGLPLVDRQHPHDLFMELAARVDVNAGPGSLFLYGGPVGEPALGPSAFMHRASASYNPEPPITHHWFDSTHITYGVITAGYAAKTWQVEASAFRGAEPDEQRWNIETPKLDSWSVRGTLTPSPRWALQASYGEMKQPEATHPGENEHRFTASAHYADPRGFSAMAAFSAKQRVPGATLSAWLAEANWNLDRANTLFGRFENVANDELFPDHHDPLHDVTFRVSKFQLGYARRIPLGRFQLALGGSGSLYAKPAALDAAYGKSPMGYTLFAKLKLGN
ncbi:hypothetical protein [Novosphingobium sp. B 225]|uniref:hypothetical protein n=1 Tax=Novosphingobium sp. B 225 TaxID=1961849 RepID=UPI0020CED3C1|nr:hypothetical protein [Novosphingobium sp. B 225]